MAHRAYVVTGLGFGDEGKGTIVDALCQREMGNNPVVVRHGSGPQAAHNVVRPDGKHHTFSQFGSGTFVPGCKTILSKFMYVNPINMVNEEQHLRSIGVTDAFARLSVCENTPVITPYHVLANRAREQARGTNKHGTCGEGVGETVNDYHTHWQKVIRWGDLGRSKEDLRELLGFWRDAKRWDIKELGEEVPPEFDDFYLIDTIIEIWKWVYNRATTVVDWEPLVAASNGTVIFEGAQGVLLDEYRGFHPYTTWSTTTDANARRMVHPDTEVISIGVTRTYTTRHGAGPFPTEDRQVRMPELHNSGSGLQGKWRRGHLDMVLLRYAIKCCEQIDYLAITHVDSHGSSWCTNYRSWDSDIPLGKFRDLEHQKRLTDRLFTAEPVVSHFNSILEIQEHLEVPLGVTSLGPHYDHKRFYLPAPTP